MATAPGLRSGLGGAARRFGARAPFTLAVDDGPSALTPLLLDALEKGSHRALWFVKGKNAASRPELLPEILRRGHELANHSYSHPHFSAISLADARDELIATEALIDGAYAQAGRTRPGRWFRFPFNDEGGANATALQALLAELGFEAPASAPTGRHWPSTLITRDWTRPRQLTFRRTLLRIRPGDTVEFHDSRWGVRHYAAPLVQMLALRRLRAVIPSPSP